MTISIDTNVLSALWNLDDATNARAAESLASLASTERLVICAAVYAELLAGPLREEAALDQFLLETGIQVDWELEPRAWKLAGQCFQAYAMQRKRSSVGSPRRILADFLIGSQAQMHGHTVLTMDDSHYLRYLPSLPLLRA